MTEQRKDWVLFQDEVWVNAHGEEENVSQMSTRRCMSVIDYLFGFHKVARFHREKWFYALPLIKGLERRIHEIDDEQINTYKSFFPSKEKV